MLIEPAWGPCPATECPYKAFTGHCGLTACIRPELRPHNTVQSTCALTPEELEQIVRNSKLPQDSGYIYATMVGGKVDEDDRAVSNTDSREEPAEKD